MAYQAEDGSVHDSVEGAQQANREAANMARTGNPYGLTMDDLGGGLKAIVVIPYYLASICCSLFSMLFTKKMVGKVIQSIIIGALASVVITIVLNMVLPVFPNNVGEVLATALSAVSSVFFLGPAAWYFLRHYDVAKTIYDGEDGSKAILSLVLISFCIGFYGLIIAALVGLGSVLAGALIALAVSAAVVIVYIKRVKGFVEYAEANSEKGE
jgi:hypothetical protein